MKILLLGKDGQIGRELQIALAPLGSLIKLGRKDGNLENVEQLCSLIREIKPDVIVNAAAYTAVDKAESESQLSFTINASAVKILAEEANKIGAWFVHYSTDYVFDGEKDSPYVESDEPKPINTYGHSKLQGELGIVHSGGKFLIFRTSWVYARSGSNFPLSILRKAMITDQLDVVSDAFGVPTSARMIAEVTALALYRIKFDPYISERCSGIYHMVPSGVTTWYEYAKFLIDIVEKQGIPVKLVRNKIFPVGSDHYKTKASRPKNSRLDNSKIESMFGLTLPSWEDGVVQFVDELVKNKLL